jgi:hypothetical protein
MYNTDDLQIYHSRPRDMLSECIREVNSVLVEIFWSWILQKTWCCLSRWAIYWVLFWYYFLMTSRQRTLMLLLTIFWVEVIMLTYMIFRLACFMFALVTRCRPLYLFEPLLFFCSDEHWEWNSPLTDYRLGKLGFGIIFPILYGLFRHFKVQAGESFQGGLRNGTSQYWIGDKNWPKWRDVLYERPLKRFYLVRSENEDSALVRPFLISMLKSIPRSSAVDWSRQYSDYTPIWAPPLIGKRNYYFFFLFYFWYFFFKTHPVLECHRTLTHLGRHQTNPNTAETILL